MPDAVIMRRASLLRQFIHVDFFDLEHDAVRVVGIAIIDGVSTDQLNQVRIPDGHGAAFYRVLVKVRALGDLETEVRDSGALDRDRGRLEESFWF